MPHGGGSVTKPLGPRACAVQKSENTYPRPRDRRLSRKTRAAVGKPPGSTTLRPAVSSADSTGANSPSIAHQEDGHLLLDVPLQEKLSEDVEKGERYLTLVYKMQTVLTLLGACTFSQVTCTVPYSIRNRVRRP